MAQQKLFDVFLSHSTADKLAVEVLAGRLEDEAHLKPFPDRWHLVPGNPWQEELEKALDNSRTCAVFIGPTGIGPWENEEMRSALDTRVVQPTFRVVPVLLPGATMPERSRLPRFLSRLTWVDFRGPEGVHDRNIFRRLVAGINGTAPGRDASLSDAPFVVQCPYRGLNVFEEEHSRFFFGRDATIQHLIEWLRPTRFLAVLGPSGSGKSSVVRAGLLPRLRSGALPLSNQWRYRVFKPGSCPIEELALSLAVQTDTTDRTEYALRLGRNLKTDERALHIEIRLQLSNQPPDVRCCFVVDQFEEVFTLCQERAERERFVDLLRYAVTVTGGQTVVVLAMRTDFLSRAAEYSPLAELLSSHQFLVSPMDAEALRQAIEEPARLVGLGWDEGLVDMILNDIGNEPGMLPLLEDTMSQLWEKRSDKNVMTISAYRASGGVRGALAQRADILFMSLTTVQQQIARRILLRLAQPGEGTADTRRRASLQELETRAEDSEAVKTVIQILTDARLLVTEEQQVDIAHEALIRGWPRLRQWIDDDRSGLRIHRRITESAEEWRRLNRDASLLLRGALLAHVQEWCVHHERDLNALEGEFVDTSVKLKIREQEAEKLNQLRAELGMWVEWTILTIVGMTVGVSVNMVVANSVKRAVSNAWAEAVLVLVMSGAVLGTVFGFAQWFVLRKQFKHAAVWVLSTAVAVSVGMTLVPIVILGLAYASNINVVGIDYVVSGAILGVVFGLPQWWFVLRKQFKRAAVWLLATAVAVSAGMMVAPGVIRALRLFAEPGIVSGAGIAAVFGTILGIITGLPLIWLLRHPKSETWKGSRTDFQSPSVR